MNEAKSCDLGSYRTKTLSSLELVSQLKTIPEEELQHEPHSHSLTEAHSFRGGVKQAVCKAHGAHQAFGKPVI